MKVAEGSLASGEAAAPAAAARRSTSRLTFALAAFAGAAASLATERGAWAWLRARDAAAAGASVRVGPSRAASALGELSAAEVRRVATWATTAKGFLAVRGGDDFASPWLSGPSAVELFAPPKQDALAYLDGRTDVAPPRYARITAAVPREHAAVEYKIGPLQSAEADWTMEELERVPFTKRPTEPGADLRLAGPLLEAELAALGAELLEATFGPVFPRSTRTTSERPRP
ncbi:amine oxidase [Aureococcus anophagefferens]|nr:amine oxidase [Aureococcus anophagefferens]